MTKNYVKSMSKNEVAFITEALELDNTKKAVLDYMNTHDDLTALETAHNEYVEANNKRIAEAKAEAEEEVTAEAEATAEAEVTAEEVEAEADTTDAEADNNDAEVDNKALVIAEFSDIANLEVKLNSEGYYILTLNKNKVKLQITKKGAVKIRANKHFVTTHEKLKSEYHKNWNMPYAIDCTVAEVVEALKEA